MTNRTKGESHQVRTNSIISLGYFILSAAIGLWLVPYLIGEIGVDGYGIIALAVSLTAYVGMAAGSINTSISRFLSMDINRDDFEGANKTFNSALVGISIGIVVILPALWVLSAHITEFIDVPPQFTQSTPALLLLLIVAFFITFLRNIFTAPAFAHNRLDLIFFSQGLELLAKIAVLVLLMRLFEPDVNLVGIATLIGAAAALVFGLYLWRAFAPYLSINWRAVRVSRFSELFVMSGWIMINQTGAILFLNVDLIVANLFVGVGAVGYYGALLQLSVALRSLAGLLAGVATPLIFSRYAKKQWQDLVTVVHRSVKYLGLVVALPVGIVCATAEPILTLWLGPDFAQFAPLVWIMLFHLAANSACRPLFAVQQAANSVKNPAIVTLALGAVHVGLSIVLVSVLDWGLYGIAISGVITLSLKNIVYTAIHAAILLKRPLLTFVGTAVFSLVATGLSALACTMITTMVPVDGWLELLVVAALSAIIYCIVVWTLMINKTEKQFLREALLSRL